METSRSQSFFLDLKLREVNGFRGIVQLILVKFFSEKSISIRFCYTITVILIKLSAISVRKRPYIGNDSLGFDPIGAVAIEHDGEPSPPMALSFCKVNFNIFFPNVVSAESSF